MGRRFGIAYTGPLVAVALVAACSSKDPPSAPTATTTTKTKAGPEDAAGPSRLVVTMESRGPDAVDVYRIDAVHQSDGSVGAEVSFASGTPNDRFMLVVTSHAMADARALLTIEQGSEHAAEVAATLPATASLRTVRFDATTLPFLPSRRLVEESRGDHIGVVALGDAGKLPVLERSGTRSIEVRVRGTMTNLEADRYVVPSAASPDHGEILFVHQLPAIGAIDLVIAVRDDLHEMTVQSVD